MKDGGQSIPVVDLFAGPGGLAEGFSSLGECAHPSFKIKLSVEKDQYAHQTLRLRSFFRQFDGNPPLDYYRFLRGELGLGDLFGRWGKQFEMSAGEALRLELGADTTTHVDLDEKIQAAIGKSDNWVLIGGPPCQAYSMAGRSRNKGIKGYKAEDDHRTFLYTEYLRIIARHWPAVFVMENVKGLLSSKVNGSSMFEKMLHDLQQPGAATGIRKTGRNRSHSYQILSFVTLSEDSYDPKDFVIFSERFGIPQRRHRVILLGVRDDIVVKNHRSYLLDEEPMLTAGDVLNGLPRLRSQLSKIEDSGENWRSILQDGLGMRWLKGARSAGGEDVYDKIKGILNDLHVPRLGGGGEFIPAPTTLSSKDKPQIKKLERWYVDKRIGGICNSSTRLHIPKDLYRYLYASTFASVHGFSPKLGHFPKDILPNHQNVETALGFGNFNDRFRVQLKDIPATTVVSHIAKDGHYYIHYDPSQCRSLTVREAARLQTFPDNYFFCGSRTDQYRQVGNAVPPLLANKIAEKVRALLADAGWTR